MKSVCFTPSRISRNDALAEVPRYVCVNNLCAPFHNNGRENSAWRSHFKPLDGLLVVIPPDLSAFAFILFFLNRATRRRRSAAALQTPECLETAGQRT